MCDIGTAVGAACYWRLNQGGRLRLDIGSGLQLEVSLHFQLIGYEFRCCCNTCVQRAAVVPCESMLQSYWYLKGSHILLQSGLVNLSSQTSLDAHTLSLAQWQG